MSYSYSYTVLRIFILHGGYTFLYTVQTSHGTPLTYESSTRRIARFNPAMEAEVWRGKVVGRETTDVAFHPMTFLRFLYHPVAIAILSCDYQPK